MQKILGDVVWKNSFKFSFVRNPWDKVVSHYCYRLQWNKNNIKQDGVSFSDWVRLAYKEQEPVYYDNPIMFSPQVDWLASQNGEIELDFIGRFENMIPDFEKMVNFLKLTAKLPHLNATTRGSYKNYYDRDTEEIIRKCFEKDIAYFGYLF